MTKCQGCKQTLVPFLSDANYNWNFDGVSLTTSHFSSSPVPIVVNYGTQSLFNFRLVLTGNGDGVCTSAGGGTCVMGDCHIHPIASNPTPRPNDQLAITNTLLEWPGAPGAYDLACGEQELGNIAIDWAITGIPTGGNTGIPPTGRLNVGLIFICGDCIGA